MQHVEDMKKALALSKMANASYRAGDYPLALAQLADSIALLKPYPQLAPLHARAVGLRDMVELKASTATIKDSSL